MSEKSQATKQATQRAKKIRKAVADNLIALDESTTPRANPKELNNRIGQIDSDLDNLKSALDDTNKGLQQSLAHLSDKDTDLRAKVAEAYQQLGVLDNAYRVLTEKSSDITLEIKAVSKRIHEYSKKTDQDIGSLGEEYRSLVERVEELAAKSKQTTQELNASIKANAKAMQALEQNLLSEINDLAKTTQQRDETLQQKTDKLAEGLDKADSEIRASQARLIKMQAIDEALQRRADALEATTEELTRKSRELSRSTTSLNQRTQQLAEAIDALQTTVEDHGEQIDGLQRRTEKTANALVALILQEKRRFWTLTGGLALLLLALGAFVLYENASWNEEVQVNGNLQAGIASVSDDLAVTDQALSRVDSRVSQVDARVGQVDDRLQQEITSLNDKLVTIGDQVGSLDGRVSNLRPNRSFGTGNVIHGPEWVAAQPAANYVIHLTTTGDKQALYTLAERYSHYLQDELAYLPVQFRGTLRYALLYGQFTTEAEAYSAMALLPRTIGRSRPMVQPMSRILDNNDKGAD